MKRLLLNGLRPDRQRQRRVPGMRERQTGTLAMDPYRRRLAAFDAFGERVRAFRGRPFPTDWARVVGGVGLASFSMRVERVLSTLPGLGELKPEYARGTGVAGTVLADLGGLLRTFDDFVDALPPGPRAYFEDMRGLVADASVLVAEWWPADGGGARVSGTS